MNRNKLFFGVLVMLAFLGGTTACTKRVAPDTPFTRITGKWKLASSATDDNGDHVIESGEIHSVAAGEDVEIQFNADSTGISTTVSNGTAEPALSFRWKILDGDSVYTAYSSHDTITYYLAAVNSSNLTLTTNIVTPSGPVLAAYYYNKN